MANEDRIKMISSLAERFPNPDEFISVLERLSINLSNFSGTLDYYNSKKVTKFTKYISLDDKNGK